MQVPLKIVVDWKEFVRQQIRKLDLTQAEYARWVTFKSGVYVSLRMVQSWVQGKRKPSTKHQRALYDAHKV